MICYRYMKSHGFETLDSGRFKMASVLDLNDPFEGLGCCVGVLPEQTVKDYLRQDCFAGGIKHPSDVQAFETFWNGLGEEPKQTYTKLASSKIRTAVADRTLVKYMYVLCFSMCEHGDPAEKLMWSHYADGYKGVRIGIRMDDPHFPLYFDSVKYCCERPQLDLAKVTALERDKEITRFWIQNLTTKSNEWAYERECRIIADDLHLEKGKDDKGNDAYFWRFKPSDIVNVDLGLNTTKEREKKILDVVKAKYPTASIRKVVLSDANYGISYQEVK